MCMNYDFSFANPEIRSWFDRNSTAAPVRQFVYLHEHPLVRPNFIAELDVMIYETGAHIQAKNITGSPIKRLQKLAKEFADALTKFVVEKEEGSAEKVLLSMRELHTFCRQVKSM